MSEQDMHPKKAVELYVVYERPSDYPDHYVVRRHLAEAGKVTIDPKYELISKSLDYVQYHLVFELGLIRLPKDLLETDPVIIEVYM